MVALAHGRTLALTLAQAGRRRVERLEREGSPSLYDARSLLRQHTAWAGARPVHSLTVLELRAYVAEVGQRLSAARARAVGYWLVSCLAEAGVDLEPRALRLPRRQRAERGEILDAATVARLVRSTRGHEAVRALVATLCLTGARPSEARALRVGAVDRSGEVWLVRYAEQLHPKSGARAALKDLVAREVPVHPELRRVLEQLHGVDLEGTDPARALLPRPATGRAWDDNSLRAAWAEYLAAHGAPALTPRRARHTAISLYLDAGAAEAAVRSITHPASPAQGRGAFGRYVHITTEARVRAVLSLRLPVVEVLDDAQLTMEFA